MTLFEEQQFFHEFFLGGFCGFQNHQKNKHPLKETKQNQNRGKTKIHRFSGETIVSVSKVSFFLGYSLSLCGGFNGGYYFQELLHRSIENGFFKEKMHFVKKDGIFERQEDARRCCP
jgi:hypothetical protein